jgi:hypothetical protein
MWVENSKAQKAAIYKPYLQKMMNENWQGEDLGIHPTGSFSRTSSRCTS